jgi:HEPN domain-containing protein
MESDAWHPWWDEAEYQNAVAKELLAAHHFSSAIFHALMARELAIKALRTAPATYGDLEHATYDELQNYTWDQLGQGVGLRKDHFPKLDAPWQRGYPASESAQQIADVETELGLAVNSLYEACRYPDRWPDGARAPHLRLDDRHAERVLATVEGLLITCRERFNGMREEPDGAGNGGVAS